MTIQTCLDAFRPLLFPRGETPNYDRTISCISTAKRFVKREEVRSEIKATICTAVFRFQRAVGVVENKERVCVCGGWEVFKMAPGQFVFRLLFHLSLTLAPRKAWAFFKRRLDEMSRA